MIVCTVLYKTDADFDFDYYVNKHRPWFDATITPLGMKKAEARRVLGTVDGSTPSCHVIANVYFDTMEEFQSAMQHPSMGEIIADIPNFYKGTPEIMVTQNLD